MTDNIHQRDRLYECGERGYTFVELLVLIAIIGMLSAVALVSLNAARENARDAKRKLDMRNIVTAIELEHSTAGYPFEPTLAPIASTSISVSGAAVDSLGAPYMYTSDSSSFKLYGNLEDESDIWLTVYPSDDPAYNVMLSSTGSLSVASGDSLYLRLDESPGATTFTDSSGAGNDGVCTGDECPVAGAGGKFGTAALFDGDNDMIEVGPSSGLDITGNITITMWMYPTADAHNSWNYLMYERTPNYKFEFGFYNDNEVRFKPYNTSGSSFDFSDDDEMTTNTWHHVAAVRDGSNLFLYVDGLLVGSRDDFTESLRSATVVRVGGNGSSGGFDGRIDEVSIYSRALTASEVYSLSQQ